MTEPFKITELGFYKMRNRGKCEVVHMHAEIESCCVTSGSFVYLEYRKDGKCLGGSRLEQYDIVSKWKEPKKVMLPAVDWYEVDGDVFVVNGKDYRATTKPIYTYPAHEITVED